VGVAVAPDSRHAYVVNSEEVGKVAVIDTVKYTVSDRIEVGANPVGVAVTPDGRQVYVSNINSSTVSVISDAD
ncbi:YncE family protein, partial [Rhodococcus erythropolis]|uniref:YncE family protein n=1 Tax=Rhodococcus erythropolis TaxID=1833 RepID=UPI002948C8C4|nr:YncE family protein [Rhodococcus erythropolis]